MSKNESLRFLATLSGIFFLYLLLVIRLFYWQVVKAQGLREQGLAQSSQTIKIPSIRGEILSSDGFPVAANTISYLLYANPKVISGKQTAAEKLAPILRRDQASVSAQLSRDLYWVRLADGLSQDDKNTITNLNIKGLGFEKEYSRFYPEASMSAQLLGFLGKNNQGVKKGYFGVEGEYNDQLSGRDGMLYAIKDALGNQIINDIREDQKIDGRSITLTLDRTVQFDVDKRLADGIQRYGADGGTAIVMDTKTGAILAMSSFPRFDPGKYWQYNPETYTNPALSSLYEPGSTFKVIVMSAALDSHLVTPDTICNICSGPVQIGEYKIRTWNDKYNPNSTMNDVIVHSDNTGMVFVGRKLGVDNFIKYLKKFGLGEQTGIDLQGETSGVIKGENKWYPVDLATASFGQGISLTPIQLLTAVNSIANGGVLMQPYVVSAILTDDGKKITIKPKQKQRTISSAAASTMTQIMVNAVENGEAKWTKIKNYKIAGKTGTAQIPVAGHYDPSQTVASFVGYFPANSPKVTMLVLLNRPRVSIYGSETAAPIFFSIARDLIKYYNLPSQ